MRLEILDQKKGVLKIRIDSEDDLWLLSLLITPGDFVKAITTRDVSLGYEKRRIPMVLTLRVLKTEFQPFTNRLRIHGVVVEGPDRFGVKGSHHTINVDIGHEITLFKQSWSPKLIDELLKLVRPVKLILVALDFDEYAIAVVQSQGMKIVDEKSISLPIRDDRLEKVKPMILREIASRVVETAQRYNIDVIVIGSPGSLKEELRDYIKELSPNLKVYLDTVANGGYAGIQELLNRDTIRQVLEDIALAEASRVLEEFDYFLVKDINRVAYGLEQVEFAAKIGAIDKLVIVDEMLSLVDENRLRVENILKDVAEKKGRIVIVPTNSPPGQRVKLLGGIIAILRYSIDLDTMSRDEKQ
ncbi:MAG TPA: mRNA surveillance protein pelota [Ignisphaera sp.]|nr:mRNA surveillance protein pelota [Ignisphaera sp.]